MQQENWPSRQVFSVWAIGVKDFEIVLSGNGHCFRENFGRWRSMASLICSRNCFNIVKKMLSWLDRSKPFGKGTLSSFTFLLGSFEVQDWIDLYDCTLCNFAVGASQFKDSSIKFVSSRFPLIILCLVKPWTWLPHPCISRSFLVRHLISTYLPLLRFFSK